MAKENGKSKGVNITLPDGSVKSFDGPVSGDELAASIGPGLAKATLAVKVDGILIDSYIPITGDAKVSIITSRDDEGLELLRHDCAHVMAEAVKELYPETQITIGPVIEDGFFYDFSRPEPFTEEDLPKIEARMKEIVARDEDIRREVWDRKKAIKFFKDQGEVYKAEIIADLPEGEEVSLYRQGDWIDLCRGPHLPSTGKLGTAFKLMKVAGAYWRGDSRNEMLTRIYGTCWRDKKELKAYLLRLEEAKKRDHRKLGKEMDLFHFQEESPGAVFWHAKGWRLFQTLVNYMRRRQDKADYEEISTPDILDKALWVTSGHVEKFGENMFYTNTPDGREYALKPMNCPGGVLVFGHIRGPHLPSTGKLGTAFKLMKVAGAYWRGDSRNEMLTRIYGTCWRDKKELKAYLLRLEEAKKRDHRKLGKEMDLFHFQEESPGAVFWHAKGWRLFQTLVNYMRRRQDKADYEEISTPDILDKALWVTSGHVEKFGENMFYTNTPDGREYALKPMNCPGGVLVFGQGLKSYRDLPMRVAEFGKVHRFEPSGALHGLMRVRAFTQDDAHIYCTQEQMKDECISVTNLCLDIYKDFGFEDVAIKFADRPERRIGSDEVWDKSEKALREAIEATGHDYVYNPGEGAFYGPKLEFVLKDAIGRDWQCGTLQMDLNLPERFDLSYIGEDGNKHRPVMLHRALFGSLERFTGILIEHYAGRMPLWLAPLQVVVTTITQDGDDFAQKAYQAIRDAGLSAHVDLRNEKINYKIREHSLAKVPVILVIGKREAEEGTVTIRRLGQQDQKTLPLDEAIKLIAGEATPPG